MRRLLPGLRAVELVVLFVLVPLLLWWIGERGVLFGTLWLCSLLAGWWLWRQRLAWGAEWHWSGWLQNWRWIVGRFLLCAVAMTIFLWAYDPDRLLGFPRDRPALWAMVMLVYPLFSVLPQEILYRTFFLRRYGQLVAGRWSVLLSGLLFGLAHLALNNWVAVIFSAIGGMFFMHTYRRTRSLAAVCVEHALYGCFVFTIGLGWYFFSGAGH